MNNHHAQLSDEQLIALICSALDEDLQNLTPDMHARLDTMRMQALQQESIARTADEETLVQIARESLTEASPLQPAIEDSLDQIRLQAISRLSQRQSRPSITRWLLSKAQGFSGLRWPVPAAALASSFAIVGTVAVLNLAGPTTEFQSDSELALLASAEEIELYENLEFYLWLSENELVSQ